MAERIPTDMDTFLREHAARATPLPEVREAALARWPHSPDADDDQRRSHAARIETAYKHRRKHARDAARAALASASAQQESASVEGTSLSQAVRESQRDSLLGISIMEPITAPPCTAGDLAELIRSLPPPDAEYSADVQDISAGSTAPFDPLAEWTDGVDPAPFLRRIDAATRCGTDESVPRLQRMTEAVEALGVTVDNVRRAVEASPNRPVGHLSLFEVAAIAVDALRGAPQAITVRSDVERLDGVVDNLAAQVGRLTDAVSQMLSQAQDAAAAKDALIETQRRFIEHLQRMVGA